jgi:hypothetical protein
MSWNDFSEYITHFTKPVENISDYKNHLSILGGRKMMAKNTFGIARKTAPEPQTQETVCFSEIPLHCLDRLADRRSRYGIGFKKDIALSKGALPIWYVEKDTVQHQSITHLMNRALNSPEPTNDPIWKLTPFIDVPGEYGKSEYRFEWEREWRCIVSANKTASFFLPRTYVMIQHPKTIREDVHGKRKQSQYPFAHNAMLAGTYGSPETEWPEPCRIL